MRLPSNIVLARIFFVIAAGLLVLVFTHKREAPAAVAPIAAPNENAVNNYIAEVEKKNELERDEIEQAHKIAKLAKEKKDSVECQFWTQQKAKSSKPNPKTDEKITQFCELEATIAPL